MLHDCEHKRLDELDRHDRLERRFLRLGADGCDNEELLVLLLSGFLLEGHQHDVARMLLARFGGISEVVNAAPADLENLAPDIPPVRAFGVELNQVWANLVDNAIDAVAASGRIEVTAGTELDRVVVRIVDDGPGIPRGIQGRIFDPFFTTKVVGQGTGLVLDIVRRVLHRQYGEIDVDSRPGRTEFRVSLPVSMPG